MNGMLVNPKYTNVTNAPVFGVSHEANDKVGPAKFPPPPPPTHTHPVSKSLGMKENIRKECLADEVIANISDCVIRFIIQPDEYAQKRM